MSRKWGKPNHRLPGWGHHKIPNYGFKQSDWPGHQKQSPALKRRNKRRRHKGKLLAKRKAQSQRFREEPTKFKYLELKGRGHISVWRGRYGKWRCICSGIPFDWFLSVAHPDIVKQFCVRNHIEWEWHSNRPALRCLPDCPSKSVQSESSADGNAAIVPKGNIQKAEGDSLDKARPHEGQSVSGP